jgi:hypothetical protein
MFKNLLQHSIIYGISSILQNAAGFFLLPLYTAYYSRCFNWDWVLRFSNIIPMTVTPTMLERRIN